MKKHNNLVTLGYLACLYCMRNTLIGKLFIAAEVVDSVISRGSKKN